MRIWWENIIGVILLFIIIGLLYFVNSYSKDSTPNRQCESNKKAEYTPIKEAVKIRWLWQLICYINKSKSIFNNKINAKCKTDNAKYNHAYFLERLHKRIIKWLATKCKRNRIEHSLQSRALLGKLKIICSGGLIYGS